jgi:hypothetical protein
MWTRHLPWMFAVVWLLAKLYVRSLWEVDQVRTAGVLINILFVLLIVFVGIQTHYGKQKGLATSFFDDFKACMKPAMLFVICAVVSMAVYYAWLSDDIHALQQNKIETFNAAIEVESSRAEILNGNKELAAKSNEELREQFRADIERNVSLNTLLLGGTLALTFISFAYSLLAVFFWRTFVRKL